MGSLGAVGSLWGSLVHTMPLNLVNNWPTFMSLSLNLGTWMRGTRFPFSEPTVFKGRGVGRGGAQIYKGNKETLERLGWQNKMPLGDWGWGKLIQGTNLKRLRICSTKTHRRQFQESLSMANERYKPVLKTGAVRLPNCRKI